MRYFTILFACIFIGCMKNDCTNNTTVIDPGWEQKWTEQNNGEATWYWCECHTAQPLAPSIMYGTGPAPIRNLEDGHPWGLGGWERVTPEDVGPKSSRFVAMGRFESQAPQCTTDVRCYDLLHMTPDTCEPEKNAPGPGTGVGDPLPPPSSGSGGDM